MRPSLDDLSKRVLKNAIYTLSDASMAKTNRHAIASKAVEVSHYLESAHGATSPKVCAQQVALAIQGWKGYLDLIECPHGASTTLGWMESEHARWGDLA